VNYKKTAKIVGLGTYLPKKVLTNLDLEKMVDTSDEWIKTRTGIRERRIAEKGTATSELAYMAAKSAIKNAGLRPKDIELIIVATITPDMQFPSTSCMVQKKLGAFSAACFDIGAACSGFIYGMNIAREFLANGTYKNALIIGAELLSTIVDWSDRNTCILFGDGAGAAVLVPSKSNGIISTYLGADGRDSELLTLPGGGSRFPATYETLNNKLHFLKMSGNEVFKMAVRIMADAVNKALSKCNLTCKDIDCLIPHQANIRIIKSVAKRINLCDEKVYINLERYGNMSSASTAVALAEAVKTGKIKKGDIVALVAFGSGLTWGASVLKW
jgi:3-oxoacyl-[acyl-carrier-protein] synthase-3